MLVFKKDLMLKRLEKENSLNKVNSKVLRFMIELDGKEVFKNEWKALKFGKLEYIYRDKNGICYPINKDDVEEVEHIIHKKDDRKCR